MVPEIEAAFWADENNTSKLPEVARPQMGNAKRVFGVINKVTKYQAGKKLVPGITAIASPGHTPGHTSYVIASGNDKVLAQIDITAGVATLFARNPDWQFIFDTDKRQAVETRKKLYDMASADKMLVQAYHDCIPVTGLRGEKRERVSACAGAMESFDLVWIDIALKGRCLAAFLFIELRFEVAVLDSGSP